MSVARLLMAGLLLLALASCSSFGRLPAGIVIHDFGAPHAASYVPRVPLRLIEVRSPSWLGSSAMQYRLAGGQDPRRLVYLENRWAAAPPELIEAVLKRAFSLARAEGGGCLLRVDLDEFSQVFDTPTQSHGLVEARASLISPRADAILAQERLSYRVPAAQPNARGGAMALRDASLMLAAGVDQWLAGVDKSNGGSVNAAVLCR